MVASLNLGDEVTVRAGIDRVHIFWCMRQASCSTLYYTRGGGTDFYKVSPTPTARGMGPALLNLVVPFYLCVHPMTQNDQIWSGNMHGEWLVLWGQPRPHPKVAVGGSPCLCLHPLMQNNQIWCGNMYGEGLVCRSATPSIPRRWP